MEHLEQIWVEQEVEQEKSLVPLKKIISGTREQEKLKKEHFNFSCSTPKS